jgi:D-glycero-D-manno-heptose 1,7-bisphosphate phosphatase
MKAAVFLDRDGVLLEDTHLATSVGQIRMLEGVPLALQQLHEAGFRLIVVSNQTVVARGLATEREVEMMNERMDQLIRQSGGPPIDGFYFCPHHPKATLSAYRMNCDCRKPQTGMWLRAAREHDLDLKRSFTVGDRITDIIAGAKAGGRTVLVQSGQHLAPVIETAEPIDLSIKPDHVCAGLMEAAAWILGEK